MPLVPWATIKLNGITFPAGQYDIDVPEWNYAYQVTKTWYYPASWFVSVASDIQEIVTLVPLVTPTTYQCTFNLSTTSGASISDFAMKVWGILYPAEQTVITGLAPGIYNYEVRNVADTTSYGTWTITIVASNIVENKVISVDAIITADIPNPIPTETTVELQINPSGWIAIWYLRAPGWDTWSQKNVTPLTTTTYTCETTFSGWLKLTATYQVVVEWLLAGMTLTNTHDFSGWNFAAIGWIYFDSTGTRMFMTDGNNDLVVRYSLSSAWDLSTATYVSQKDMLPYSTVSLPVWISFDSTGTRMFVQNTTVADSKIGQYELWSAWDITNITSYTNYTFWFTLLISTEFNSTWTQVILTWKYGWSNVHRVYDLWTPRDLATATYSFELSTVEYSWQVYFSNNWLNLFTNTGDGALRRQYDMSIAYDLTTISDSWIITWPTGYGWALYKHYLRSDAQKLYMTWWVTTVITEYTNL